MNELNRWPTWPCFEESEIEAVSKVLQSGKVNYWTGEHCQLFEQEYARTVGTKYAVSLMNGTMALEAALHGLDIGPGDEVITTSKSFIATVSTIIMRGATPVFADVDLDSQNITASSIEPLITTRTKAIMVVHLAGWPCEMEAILALAKKREIYVIEDCAQAHGAAYKDRIVGSWGDVGAFSFCQDKIITTGGEGGMITTNNAKIWEKIWSFKDHGKSYKAVFSKSQHQSGFRWVHHSFGTNGRMTEMQAVIGRIQLQNLEKWINIRQRNAAILNHALSGISALRLTLPPSTVRHAYYKYYVFLCPEFLKPEWNRNRLLKSLQELGVPCSSGGCSEIYLEKAFNTTDVKPTKRLPRAKILGETSLMFFVHPTLTEIDMHKMAKIIVGVLSEASLSDEKKLMLHNA